MRIIQSRRATQSQARGTTCPQKAPETSACSLVRPRSVAPKQAFPVTRGMLSSSEGEITAFLLLCPTDAVFDKTFRCVLSQLLETFSDRSEVVICAEWSLAGVDACLSKVISQSGFPADRLRRVVLSDGRTTPFAQDIFLPLLGEGPSQVVMLKPDGFTRLQDGHLCAAVSEQLSLPLMCSSLRFEGGNLLALRDHVLVGWDGLSCNSETASTQISGTTLFDPVLGPNRKLLPLGGKEVTPPDPVALPEDGQTTLHHLDPLLPGQHQPLFHIDMYVTPLGQVQGQDTVLVAEPRPSPQWQGQVDLLAGLPFDETAHQLENAGYRVLRVPITTGTLAQHPDRRRVDELSKRRAETARLRAMAMACGARGSDFVGLRKHHVLSWSNVLVENSAENGLHIVMPTYDHPFDDICAGIYSDLGARVTRMPDMTSLASLRGAVHCMVRELARSSLTGERLPE